MRLKFLQGSLESKFIRGLISLWLNDPSILNLGIQLGFDFFEQKTNDYYQARKAERLFEEVADTVLKDLTGFIENEHRHLKRERTANHLLMI